MIMTYIAILLLGYCQCDLQARVYNMTSHDRGHGLGGARDHNAFRMVPVPMLVP